MFIVALCSSAAASAMPPIDSVALKAKQDEHLQIYRKAIEYNDLGTAAASLVGYLHAGGATNYNDTLAVVYYSMNNLAGAYKLAKECYARDNKDVTALTLLADVSGQTNDAKVSLDWYEKLCALNPNPFNHYQTAAKQFTLDRRAECRESLKKAIADSAAAMKQMVSLQIGQGYSENVPVLAAAYNMLGVLDFKDNKTAEARKNYEAAVKAFPDFVIGKQNIDSLNKPADTKKGATKKKQ